MKKMTILPALLLLYVIIGYLSYSAIVGFYFADVSVSVSNYKAFLIKPFLVAAFYFVWLIASFFIFKFISTISLRKEFLFHILYLITNFVLLSIVVIILKKDIASLNNTGGVVFSLDDFSVWPYYLTSSILSLLVFCMVRKKWFVR